LCRIDAAGISGVDGFANGRSTALQARRTCAVSFVRSRMAKKRAADDIRSKSNLTARHDQVNQTQV
jgi:hypothetical protein